MKQSPFLYTLNWIKFLIKKSRLRETKNLSTDTDSRTSTILERLRDLSQIKGEKTVERLRDFKKKKFIRCCVSGRRWGEYFNTEYK